MAKCWPRGGLGVAAHAKPCSDGVVRIPTHPLAAPSIQIALSDLGRYLEQQATSLTARSKWRRNTVYQYGDLQVRVDRRRKAILVFPQGEPRPLTSNSLRLLAHLVRCQGQLLLRDDVAAIFETKNPRAAYDFCVSHVRGCLANWGSRLELWVVPKVGCFLNDPKATT